MANSNIETKVEHLLKKEIEDLGYECYDVQYLKEGKDYYLRITIDKTQGISIEDCEKVNRRIDPLLEETDFLKESYFLEVSSPGIERVLRKNCHFEKQIGNVIQVKLYQAIEKQKEWTGKLVEFGQNELLLEKDGKLIKIERKNIATAKAVATIF